MLLSFSLASRTQKADGISSHPLVHAWAGERLDVVQKREIAVKAFHLIATVGLEISTGNSDGGVLGTQIMPACGRLLPLGQKPALR
jgi:hypothetical protein